MIHLSNLHSYLVLNGAVAIGFIISRIILSLPFVKRKVLQKHRLQFARYTFISVIVVFFLMPSLLSLIPSSYHSNFQIEPILKEVSVDFLQQQNLARIDVNQIRSIKPFFSINILFMVICLVGFGLFLTKYIKNLFALNKIRQNALCRHNIKNVHLLFSHSTEIPFCWSTVKNHFIVIPNAFLVKINDLKLAIRHELHHIRQGDTYWLHFLILIKSFCFWNPFMKLWINWLNELQEFSCDEAIVLRKKTLPITYAECLLNVASDAFKKELIPQGALGIQGLTQSILYRRINMLFNHQHRKAKKISIISAYIISFFAAVSAAYALNGSSSMSPLSIEKVATLIKQSHLDQQFQVTATPEVVNEINNIRSSEQARSFMHDSLQRMKHYQPVIQEALKKASMPNDLLAVPIVESGYQPLDQNKNPVHAAGIWQIIPTTANRFELVVNNKRDDRLDTQLSTKAALSYLNQTYKEYGNWKLAFVAYEIGEQNTDQLIKETKSHDAWVLARAPMAPDSLKKSVAMFDAALIIMHNPSLIEN